MGRNGDVAPATLPSSLGHSISLLFTAFIKDYNHSSKLSLSLKLVTEMSCKTRLCLAHVGQISDTRIFIGRIYSPEDMLIIMRWKYSA